MPETGRLNGVFGFGKDVFPYVKKMRRTDVRFLYFLHHSDTKKEAQIPLRLFFADYQMASCPGFLSIWDCISSVIWMVLENPSLG